MDNRTEGCFFPSEQTAAIEFCSISDLVLKVDRFCNFVDTPQAAMALRTFGKPVHRRGRKKLDVVHNPAMLQTRGKVATFVVTVLFRQSASWQGTVQWCEGKEKVPFRSVLELLHLMDSALELKGKNIRKKPAKSTAVLQGVGL